MTRDIETRTTDFIRKRGFFEEGDAVLVALSGGADSVCLLRVLLALRERLSLSVFAAHYNHQLRGADSLRDEQFVRTLCEQLDVPLTVSSGEVAEEAKRTRRSVEETARDMRYAFLEETAQAVGASKIATGHHADDNAETVLLHLTRGAGLRGLAGIPPRRGCIVRPLLSVSRQEILEYLSDLGQDFVEDHTNADTSIRRNGMRHLVMPLLQEQNPNLMQTITRQSEILRQDALFLDRMAAEAFAELQGHCRGQRQAPRTQSLLFQRRWQAKPDGGFPSWNTTCCEGKGNPSSALRTAPLKKEPLDSGGMEELPLQGVVLPTEALLALDPAISSRVVALAIQAVGGEAAEVHVRRVLELARNSNPSVRADLSDCVVRREYDCLVFASEAMASTPFAPQVLPSSGTVLIPDAGLQITVLLEPTEKTGKVPTFLFQSASICGKISVRSRKMGDSIRLDGLIGTKTVKKLMIERKIPAHVRDAVPVFTDDLGVIAVFGIGIAARVAPKLGDEVLGILVEELGYDA